MFTNVKTSAIMKKKFRKLGWEYSRWEIFRSVFSRGGFTREEFVEIFRVGGFVIPKKIYAKNSQVYMH